MSKQTVVVVIAVIAALVIFLVARMPRQKLTKLDDRSANSFGVVEATKSTVKPTFNTHDEGKRELASGNAPVAPTMGAAYFRDEEGRKFIVLNLSPKQQCIKGDADGMIALGEMSGAKIIATLEPLESRDANKGTFKELTTTDLTRGTNIVFEIKDGGPKAFVVAVCSETGDGKSCLGKPPADLVFGYESFMMSLTGNPERNLVFFVHLLVLHEHFYQVYQSDFSLSSITKMLSATFNKANLDAGEILKAKYIANLLAVTRPYPLAPAYDGAGGTVLNLAFTKEDGTLCSR